MANEAINASAGRQTATSTMTAPRSPCCRCVYRSEEHTSELQSQSNLVCRLLLEKKKKYHNRRFTTDHRKIQGTSKIRKSYHRITVQHRNNKRDEYSDPRSMLMSHCTVSAS